MKSSRVHPVPVLRAASAAARLSSSPTRPRLPEMTDAQIVDAQKRVGLPVEPVLRTTSAWRAAIAIASASASAVAKGSSKN